MVFNLLTMQNSERVDWLVMAMDFQMQMGPGGQTCLSNMTDGLFGPDPVTLADKQLREMGIAGAEAIAMINLYHLAIAAFLS
jgi:hydroxylamine reductase (hybrid-cluster protein)